MGSGPTRGAPPIIGRDDPRLVARRGRLPRPPLGACGDARAAHGAVPRHRPEGSGVPACGVGPPAGRYFDGFRRWAANERMTAASESG